MTTSKHSECSNDAVTEAWAVASYGPEMNQVPLRGLVLAASGNCAHLLQFPSSQYLGMHEFDRRRFAGILADLVRGIPRNDINSGGARARVSPLGVVFSSCSPHAGRVVVGELNTSHF